MSPICVVFDVDDTLFLERDYVRSGFEAVGAWAERWLGLSGFSQLCNAAHDAGRRGQIFNTALADCQVSPTPELIAALVSLYRTHTPDIRLSEDASTALARLSKDLPLAVITDGPAISQSRKIEALGLRGVMSPIVLTEVLGREFCKPHQRAFLDVQAKVDARRFVYVADNPAKDFIAPRELGWRSIRIRRSGGLHAAVEGGGDFELPDCTGLEELVLAIAQRA